VKRLHRLYLLQVISDQTKQRRHCTLYAATQADYADRCTIVSMPKKQTWKCSKRKMWPTESLFALWYG